MKRIFFTLSVFVLLSALPMVASATVGVSVNTGKITLNQALVPGVAYDLPSNIEVKNIGTEASDYAMSVEYNEVQTQLKPKADWFRFNPATFHLLPGESKIVKVSVAPAASAIPGGYFTYIEAHSVKGPDKASISGAAATKLYFSVAPSDFFKKCYYNMLSYTHNHSRWAYPLLWVISVIIFSALWRRIRLMTSHNHDHTHHA